MKSPALYIILLVASCGHVGWIEDLVPKLRCGMPLEEVRGLTEREIRQATTMPWLGSYRVDGRRSDVWLDFQEGSLVSVIAGRIDGLTSVRLSPKKNLCTGALTFRLSVVLLSQDLLGAAVFLDENRVANMDEIQRDIEVSAGQHELRIEKEGYRPFILELDLGPDDPGDQSLELKMEGKQLVATRQRHR